MTQPNLDNMTALELWLMLKQPGVLHLNILRGLLPLARVDALHLAGATDYDSIKAALEAAQAEAEKWHNLLKQDCDDWAETDTHLRNAAKKILPADVVDGSKFGVPSVETVVDAVVAEAERLQGENDTLIARLDSTHAGTDRLREALEAEYRNTLALRAENARLREALGYYAKRDDWQQAPSDFGNVDSDSYDWFMCDGNGWETAERALATNETPAA